MELENKPKISGNVGQPHLSSSMNTLLSNAEKESKKLKDDYISVEHILLGILKGNDKVSSLLKTEGVNEADLIKAIKALRGN